jgi:hypothetical protein
MRSSAVRTAVVSAVAAGVLAIAAATAGAANAETIAGGTGSLTANASYLGKLAQSLIVVVPTGAQSYTYTPGSNALTATYAVTGGDADLNNFAGTVQYSGGLTFVNLRNGKQAKLTGLQFDLLFDQVDATPAGGAQTDVLETIGSDTVSISGTTQTLADNDLAISADGAAYLNSALGTSAFHAEDQVGTFATSYHS